MFLQNIIMFFIIIVSESITCWTNSCLYYLLSVLPFTKHLLCIYYAALPSL